MTGRLLDERSRPALRQVIGRLLRESHTADMALSRVRLGALDLSAQEVAGPRHCRVLLGELDATVLMDAAPPTAATELRHLRDWLTSDRLEVRSAGLGAWTPDFSVFRTSTAATSLLGAHYFGNPQLAVGPSFTVFSQGLEAADKLTSRFEELWGRGHDVAPAIREVLERVHD